MFASQQQYIAAIVVFSVLSVAVCSGQMIKVKIIQRQNNETGYSSYIPGHIESTSHTNLSGDSTTNGNIDLSSGDYHSTSDVSLSGTTKTDGTITAPRVVSYSVTGATLSLLLPDGRVAVVNCVSKENMNMAQRQQNLYRRSCRMPMIDNIQAEFKGKNVKLIWPVSLDGKKFESETYKILAVLDK